MLSFRTPRCDRDITPRHFSSPRFGVLHQVVTLPHIPDSRVEQNPESSYLGTPATLTTVNLPSPSLPFHFGNVLTTWIRSLLWRPWFFFLLPHTFSMSFVRQLGREAANQSSWSETVTLSQGQAAFLWGRYLRDKGRPWYHGVSRS